MISDFHLLSDPASVLVPGLTQGMLVALISGAKVTINKASLHSAPFGWSSSNNAVDRLDVLCSVITSKDGFDSHEFNHHRNPGCRRL